MIYTLCTLPPVMHSAIVSGMGMATKLTLGWAIFAVVNNDMIQFLLAQVRK